MSGLLLTLVDKLCGAMVSLPLVLICVFVWDRQRARRRWGWMAALVLYLSAMYIVIGVPGIQYITWEPIINWVPFRDFTPDNIRGMVLNAVMFAPLGFLLPAYFEGFRKWNTTLAAGFTTSLAIECIQLFTFRATDVDYLIMNTLGTLAGYLLAKLLFRHRSPIYRGRKDWLELLVINIIILLTTVFIRYPLMGAILKMV